MNEYFSNISDLLSKSEFQLNRTEYCDLLNSVRKLTGNLLYIKLGHSDYLDKCNEENEEYLKLKALLRS